MLQKSLLLFILIASAHYSVLGQNQLSLDGEWQIIFDTQNQGREAGWIMPEVFDQNPDRQDITVPAAWELYKQDYEGVAFYKKEFRVPEHWNEKIVRLQFDAVNYISEVWLNGEVIGFHEGGFTPFEFRVDGIIKTGEENQLTMRVQGPIILADTKVDGIGKMETPQWRGGISGGIWQPVKLVTSGDIFVKDVFIRPNIHDNTVSFDVTLDHTAVDGRESDILITVYHPNTSTAVAKARESWTLKPGINKGHYTVEVPDAKFWSPADPNLYKVEIKVTDKETISDSWSYRFGFRELTIHENDFYLNGERIYLKAAFFEGLYPNRIAYPDHKEMIRKEMELAKDAGFNMIRPWRRPPAKIWLDLADEMGILVVGSPVLECMQLPISTPYLPSRVENEVRESILRDRNRVCIVQWELFNELHRPVLKQLMRPMAMLARNLDPTRLILDESGGWAFGANMYLPNQYEPTKFNDIHNYPGPFINKERYDGYLSIGLPDEEKKQRNYQGNTPGRNVVPGLMSYVSELGYGSLPNLVRTNERFEAEGNRLTPAYRYHRRLHQEQRQVLMESGFDDLYPDMAQFYLDQQKIHGAANKRMIEAVRANPRVDGYCIHALIAGDWILGAGLIDLWREPKTSVYQSTKAANQPQIISIRVTPRNVYAEKGANLEVIGINELAKQDIRLELKVVDENGSMVVQETLNTVFVPGVSSLILNQLNTASWNGNYRVIVKAEANDGQPIMQNAYSFDVFQSGPLELPKTKVALLDTSTPFGQYLENRGVEINQFDHATPLDVLVLVEQSNSQKLSSFTESGNLKEFLTKGGNVAYLGGLMQSVQNVNQDFPFTARVHPAMGLWTCIPHLVKDHPMFEGLPVNTMMRDLYENVWASKTLRDLSVGEQQTPEPLVASIGFDWFSPEHKMHYSGPGDSWWGSDVAMVQIGKGRCLISQLRLIENLGKDPVAEKILANIIQYFGKN